jgi:CBS domain containing-hemolysin-like protein
LAVIALILAHGFFVAGEFGLVAVDRSRVEADAEAGMGRARTTLAALRSLSFQLSGAQLGITVTSLIVGFLTEPAIAPAVRPITDAVGLGPRSSLGVSIAVSLALATAMEMVVAELIPKNLAIARPVGVAYSSVPPLRLVNAALRPVIVFLNASANWTVKRLGIEPQEELVGVRSLQEIELLITSSREGGALLEEEYALLQRSISFAQKNAGDALMPRTSIIAVRASDRLQELTDVALSSGHSRFPVFDEDLDHIVGVAHIKDSYRYSFEERASVPVSEIARPALVVPESRNLEDLLLDMRRDRGQLVIVVDEYGGTAGIVTLEDILEEIVGDIEDEYDRSHESQLTSGMPAGVYVLSGLLHPDEVQELCGLEMPEGPYDTLGGFLYWLFDRIPEAGDHVSYRGWELKVVEMDGHRIDRVLIVRPRSSSEGRR